MHSLVLGHPVAGGVKDYFASKSTSSKAFNGATIIKVCITLQELFHFIDSFC
jgi:hypothetical protein